MDVESVGLVEGLEVRLGVPVSPVDLFAWSVYDGLERGRDLLRLERLHEQRHHRIPANESPGEADPQHLVPEKGAGQQHEDHRRGFKESLPHVESLVAQPDLPRPCHSHVLVRL